MRVLLTGANGFVGAHVARALVASGHEVLAMVRPTSNLYRLHDIAPNLRIVHADLSDTSRIQSLVETLQPEACIHPAWYVEPSTYLKSPANVSMLTASLHLLSTLLAADCERIVMVGTCAEYNVHTDQPQLHEESPTRPETIYAAAKLALGVLGQQLALAEGRQFIWARVFYLYGPYEDERRMIPALLRSLLAATPFPASEGSQVRDYLHVEDVASALTTLATNGSTGIYNVASGDPTTVRQIMETAQAVVGTPGLVQFGALPPRPWDPAYICGDNSRLRALGWTPRYTLPEGLRQTADWWQTRAAGLQS